MPVTPVQLQDPHEALEFQLTFLNTSLATASFSNTLFSGCPPGSAVCFLALVLFHSGCSFTLNHPSLPSTNPHLLVQCLFIFKVSIEISLLLSSFFT